MPQCLFRSIMECKKNKLLLTQDQVDALEMIEVLNLNQQSLVEERKKDLSVLFIYMNGHTKGQVETKIQQWNTTLPYIRFVDMLLYFMKKHK